MKVNEYKIGNLLSINSHIGKVVTVDASKPSPYIKIFFLDDQAIVKIYEGNLSLLLDENWLIRLGFNFISNDKRGTTRYERNGFEVSVFEGEIKYDEGKILGYVHQLQNFYFEQKNKELPEIIYNDGYYVASND